MVSIRSFEAVFGPKKDRWLEYTVAGLLITSGTALTMAGPGSRRGAAYLAVGTAGTLLSVDLVFVPRGRINRIYLADAAFEISWIAAWLVAPIRERRDRSKRAASDAESRITRAGRLANI